MKKILSIIITVLVLLSCFSFCTFADTVTFEENYAKLDPFATITISDDYKTLYCGNKSYSRFSIYDIYLYPHAEVKNEVVLSDSQKEDIREVALTATKNGEMINAEIYFKDDACLSVSFVLDEFIEEYNRLMSEDFEDYYIVFYASDIPEEEIVLKTTKTLLKGEEVTLKVNEFLLNDWFDVSCKSADFNLYVTKGILFEHGDDYYYVDYAEIGSSHNEFDHYTYNGKAYKVTDPHLLQQIEETKDTYYKEDYGIFLDDDFSKAVSNVFLVLVCGIVPLAIFVLSLIFGLRARKIYKKLFLTICGLSAAELIIFIILAFII